MQLQLITPQGAIPYTLTYKKVRNINLRIRPDGEVAVSAPRSVSQKDIEAFLLSKAQWLHKHRGNAQSKPTPLPCRYSNQECLALFTAVSDGIFPLFADVLKGEKPLLKVRDMKSRWGVCYPAKKTITLNTRLAEKPRAALEYVVLHEYVHFIHPDHQQGFHREMARLMPDYKERRKLLRTV